MNLGRYLRLSCRFSLLIVLFTVTLLAPQRSGATSGITKVNLYALIVAVGKQKEPSQNPLPIQDAFLFRDFLVERKHLFSDVKVAMLVDEKATKTNIMNAITRGLREPGKEDVVIIFLEGHGSSFPSAPGRYYFLPYDFSSQNAADTSICVSDKELFTDIRSERLLFLTGSCLSGGFLSGLARGVPKQGHFDFLKELHGRYGISASQADEVAWAGGKFGMNVFGFYIVKGLRGSADTSKDGTITVKELYDYVHESVSKETHGAQHPQLMCAKGAAENAKIYSTPTFTDALKIKVKFFYEAPDNQVLELTDKSVLKSGQHVGVAFKAESDCYVHIFWWDSSGQVGRLFPNPRLTEGDGLVKAGETHWLPSKGGKRWYVLDNKPGYETVYFVASRERNPRLTELYEGLKSASQGSSPSGAGGEDNIAQAIEREINLMGFADYTVPAKARTVSYESKEKLFEQVESKIKVSGVDAFFKIRFKHEAH